eukprot:TRINITY_DN67154_c0_g1_i1.p2 TRINITY_DN67154_c0_g1~~TRINITY_DN67154_c0_g1_i1.p2  ORF type:complete len:255 (-),score=51.31 TRINITY_DN67154_c0_g1_i1:104-868(-)
MAKRSHDEVEADRKVMVVTGGSSGVGENLVRHFAQKGGWKIYATARGIEALKSVCDKYSPAATPIQCDISNKEQVADMVSKVLSAEGRIDVLVNNAAVSHDGKKFWELETEDIDRLIDVNLKGTMYVTHAVLKQAMVPQNSGYIFGVASVAGTWGIPTESCYVASKHGMVGFLDSVANETRDTGISVSTLCPGGIDTPWWRKDHPYSKTGVHDEGTTSHLTQTQEIVDLIDFQLGMPRSTVFKRVVLFPRNEWH